MKIGPTEELKKVEIPKLGRFYQSPTSNLWFPSVTTIVNYQDRDKWKKWREDPNNLKISEAAISRGNRLHNIVEEYLINGTLPQTIEDRKHFDLIFDDLQTIGELQAIESTLWSDNLRMAGRVDCIAEYNGELAVIDFKTAGKPKKKAWIQNYFNQAAAYAWMWEERTGQVAKKIVLMIATDSGESQLFVENRNDYKVSLGEAIKGYWKENDFHSIQEIIANELADKMVQE